LPEAAADLVADNVDIALELDGDEQPGLCETIVARRSRQRCTSPECDWVRTGKPNFVSTPGLSD
jgi:hypothetical protein